MILAAIEYKLLTIKKFNLAAGCHVGFLYLQHSLNRWKSNTDKNTSNLLIIDGIE